MVRIVLMYSGGVVHRRFRRHRPAELQALLTKQVPACDDPALIGYKQPSISKIHEQFINNYELLKKQENSDRYSLGIV